MTTARLDPLAASKSIIGSYRRYLCSSFRPANATLRSELEDAINTSFRISRGPLLQASAPYAHGDSITDLISAGVLHPSLTRLPPSIFPPARPLYRHQQAAIERIARGDNTLVATGTGSGKTECFLLPIINCLLGQASGGGLGPGVRALLLYPMNALANDQMLRIRGLLETFPEITFGRYTGETPATRPAALEAYRQRFGVDPLPNEMIDRASMQASAPHILLTNYAMLEYLLLRPADSPFFDGRAAGSWRFVVLDEIHVYDGAKAAELGMLLRRVRDRVHRSQRGRLVCVGTSATLGSGEQAAADLTSYAEELFDETFEDRAGSPVVTPTRVPLGTDEPSWSAGTEAISAAHRALVGGEDVGAVAEALGGPAPRPAEACGAYLARVLPDEHHVWYLQQLLSGGAAELDSAAREVFDEETGPRALVELLDLCASAHESTSTHPLIPARYHLFLRALEGSYLCLSPDHPLGRPRLSLARAEQCPACQSNAKMVELALCRKCGAAYAVGKLSQDRVLDPASPTDTTLDYFLLDLADLTAPTDLEDEDEESLEGFAAAKVIAGTYCTACGLVSEGAASGCSCGASVSLTWATPSHESRYLRRCLACAGRSNASIASRLLTGSDAPVAVVATALYQSVPPSSDPVASLQVGEGRKLLSFADSRQDAAFFAPYLERTYSRAIERRVMWEVMQRNPEARFGDLVVPIRQKAEVALVLDEDDGPTANSNRVKSWLFRDIVGVDRRQSLDGVGLVETTVAIPRAARDSLPPALERLGLSPEEILDLARVLLDSLRRAAAVWVPDGVDIKDEMYAPRNVTTVVRGQGSEKGVLAWLPGRGHNGRLDYLNKVFEKRGITEEPRRVLEEMWAKWLTGQASPWSKVLTAQSSGRRGTIFALDPEWLTFLPRSEGHRPLQCSTCRQIWWRSVSNVCPTYLCPGTLREVSDVDLADDHYRSLYEDLLPVGARVEEHTAQLDTVFAADVQQKFIRGDVNVLSCSTTFELGVDVGDVQAVLMRNVPPSPANYVQRAGRAGRRVNSTALVVTFAQRRNHDLQVFERPHQMVDGDVTPPVISIDTPTIVRRHVHAMALSAFLRRYVEAGGEEPRTVADFFETNDGSPSLKEQLMAWLRTAPGELLEAVGRATPARSLAELDAGGWIEALDTIDEQRGTGWLARASEELSSDLGQIDSLYERAKEEDKLRWAGALDAVRTTLRSRRLVDYLAQRVVLPKYGFPVDVVALDVLQPGDRDSGRVELTRDMSLAIAEYAPGSRVVAAKRVWEGVGLRILPGRALLRRSWAVCRDCKHFRSGLAIIEEGTACPYCGGTATLKSGSYIEPSFGFIGRQSDDRPGESRPERRSFRSFHFEEYQGSPPLEEQVDVGGRDPVHVRYSRQAMVTALNGGSYWVCDFCGRATDEQPKGKTRKGEPLEHDRPQAFSNRKCSGFMRHVNLGYRYLTDAVELRLPSGASHHTGQDVSILHALLAAVPQLGITRRDVDGVPFGAGPGVNSLVLFDAVPGGAGHARQLARHAKQLLEAGLGVVDTCECGEDSSCYGCLRSYENQLVHDQLRRGLARDGLRVTLGM